MLQVHACGHYTHFCSVSIKVTNLEIELQPSLTEVGHHKATSPAHTYTTDLVKTERVWDLKKRWINTTRAAERPQIVGRRDRWWYVRSM